MVDSKGDTVQPYKAPEEKPCEYLYRRINKVINKIL